MGDTTGNIKILCVCVCGKGGVVETCVNASKRT